MFKLLRRTLLSQRRHPRLPCRVPGVLAFGESGSILPGLVRNLSQGGCLFLPNRPMLFLPSSRVRLIVREVEVPCTVVARSPTNCHCQFTGMLDAAEIEALMPQSGGGNDSGESATRRLTRRNR